jgi:hypothetical protein
MALIVGDRIGAYEITGTLGTGGPAFARRDGDSELPRGLAEAKQRPR